jgi:hypothetical protein
MYNEIIKWETYDEYTATVTNGQNAGYRKLFIFVFCDT